MAIRRIDDIYKEQDVNDIEPKVINIAIGIESKIVEKDNYKADLSDETYELIQWIISDVENIKAVLTSAKRRKAKLGKPNKKTVGKESNA